MTASAGSTPSATTPVRPTPRLASDIVRLALAAGAGVVLTGLVLALMTLVALPVDQEWIVIALFSFSVGSSGFYLLHTWLLFGPVDGATLKAWVTGSMPRGRFGRLGAELSGTGPTITVQWSIIAIAAVLVFTVWPGLAERPVTVALSILVVASSWAVTVMSYAVHYARIDETVGGLNFPDDGPRVFADYLYLAVQVQTTFSTSDVSLDTTAARKVVTGHTLVSFAFNTVIIAMLITVLFLGAGDSR